MRKILIIIVAVLISACGQSTNNFQTHTLPSGKQVKVVGVGKIFFSNDKPALMLTYQTDLSIDDKQALSNEADEIWDTFRIDVDKAGLSTGIVSANEQKKGFIVTTSRGFNFVYKKSPDGQWARTKT